MNKKFYVTTPIYYVNAKPHLGSLYSTLIADVVARWQMLLGNKTFFLTGTDEHGQKVADAAQKDGKSPKDFVDSLVPVFKDVWKQYTIEYDYFIRTTDDNHKKGAQQFLSHLLETGAVYKDTYEGWYCVSCETFISAKDIKDFVVCTSCGRETQRVSEQTYFFRLSAYQQQLQDFYNENLHFITPKERFNEVISFVQSGLKDLSISRTTVPWGIEFPNDPEHTIYVWTEALCNYITAVGYGDNVKQPEFAQTWPADIHVVGKDIVRFHAVYWPAFLMAAGLQPPKRLLVHGWITVDKQKMSKSLGNVVDPVRLADDYGVDQIRYFLLKQIAITQDGNFSFDDLEQAITSDLANNVGNLFNRMVTLASKYECMNVKRSDGILTTDAQHVYDLCMSMIERYKEHMESYYFHLAINEVLQFLHGVNAYFHAQEPWKRAKTDKNSFVELLSVVCHSLHVVALHFMPLMPSKMKKLLHGLGVSYNQKSDSLQSTQLHEWNKTYTLEKLDQLFVKPEPKKERAMDEPKKQEQQLDPEIEFKDWMNVILRVGTITKVKEVEKSDKLLCMQVDFGDHGTRQILAGIKQAYKPEDLEKKQAVFVCNLKPRKMLGLESQGMMLIARDDENNPQIIHPIVPVKNGAQLQ